MSSPLKTKTVEQLKWAFLAVLVVILIFGIILRFGSTSSEANFSVYVDEGKQRGSTNVKLVQGPRAIEAICISDNAEPLIMIDGKIAHEGSIINGFTVLKICLDRVEFEKNGKIWGRAFPNTQTSTSPKFNDLLRQPVSSEQAGYKSSDNYYKQYRQPTYREPRIAENGTYYGQISEATGRPKTVFVRGYYRKDGTYVRSHYRSPPRSGAPTSSSIRYGPSVAENDSYYGQISERTGRPKTVHVRGYYRKDGTYVRGHYRSKPRQ